MSSPPTIFQVVDVHMLDHMKIKELTKLKIFDKNICPPLQKIAGNIPLNTGEHLNYLQKIKDLNKKDNLKIATQWHEDHNEYPSDNDIRTDDSVFVKEPAAWLTQYNTVIKKLKSKRHKAIDDGTPS